MRRGCKTAALARKSSVISKMAEPEGMDVDSPAVPSTSSGSVKKRFEVKKVDLFFNLSSSFLVIFRAFFCF